MLGRGRERAAFATLLAAGGLGDRRGLLLTGDPGIGKTTLLADARRTARADGWRVLSARGDEASTEHPFGALAGLLRPLEPDIDELPRRQAAGLRVALGLQRGTAEPIAVSTAVLRLIAGSAEAQPVLLALDDVHWFDRSSTATLAAVHRQLDADRVATVATARARHPRGVPEWAASLEVWPLGGLEDDDLAALVPDTRLDPAVVRRCRDLTLGNPLGFIELTGRLRPGQQNGTESLPALADPGPVIREAFAHRLAALPARVRRALSVVAADETGSPSVVGAALALLGSPVDLEPAVAAGVLTRADHRLDFTHPLLRTAAYHSLAAASRRKAHQALAAVLDEPRYAEHRAWQLAAAASGPDEAVAAGLALVADGALARGAVASAAQVLERAADLSVDPEVAAARLTRAGELWLVAGRADQAATALARARSSTTVERTPIEAHLWGALVARWDVGPRAAASALRDVLKASDVPAPELEAALADEEHLAGRPTATARVADTPEPGDAPAAVRDRALLRLADVRLDADAAAVASVPSLLEPLMERSPLALDAAARAGQALVLEGRLLDAYRELSALLDTGSTIPGARLLAEVELAAVEARLGRADEAEARLDGVRRVARALGFGAVEDREQHVRGLVALGQGRPADAMAALAPVDRPGAAGRATVAADHAEALVGASRSPDATAWSARLEALDPSPGTLADGLTTRAAGLVAGERGARQLETAVAMLVPFPFEHARTLLVLAERTGSAEAANAALATFERLGALPWAARAHAVAHPAATAAPNAAATALTSLSAAELRVAVTVGAGRSNREAADELFLSVKTVDHHLQHIYRKLALRGRAELAVLVTRGTA